MNPPVEIAQVNIETTCVRYGESICNGQGGGSEGADGEGDRGVSGGVGVAEDDCEEDLEAPGFGAGEGVGAVGAGGVDLRGRLMLCAQTTLSLASRD